MKKNYFFLLLFILIARVVLAQSIDANLTSKKMKIDLEVFKKIRYKANSGLYKYRTQQEIDSSYSWADTEIGKSSTHRDFYNIIFQLTDFEGSLHNDTSLPKKLAQTLRNEKSGYFPYPIKWIEGKWLINFKDGEIPLGAEILTINEIPISEVIEQLYKYYTTDGDNITGKRVGIRSGFSKYYRLNYGLTEAFIISYKRHASELIETNIIKSVGYADYYANFRDRHSFPSDGLYYTDLTEEQKYKYERLNDATGILTIHSFSMGNETSQEHKNYLAFLERVFSEIKKDTIKNLIVDIRNNGGGTDPNDVVTYSYLTNRNFQESKQVWICFNKIPALKHFDIAVPRFLRPFGVGKFNRHFQNRFPIAKGGKYFISKEENEMRQRLPKENAFTGNVYLLISPEVASAGSLFGAMLTGNENTITIGEETMGGYYGHNGHTSFSYVLPKSKISTSFSIDNIEQDVPNKANQLYHRGIIPDYDVPQTIQDFLGNQDTQMLFTLNFIKNKLVN